MDFEEKKQAIKEYINTPKEDRDGYVRFLSSLEEEKADTITNSKHKEEYLEENPFPEYNLKWLDHGIYGELAGQLPYQELDFEKFSYNIMVETVEDQATVETMKAIMSQPKSYDRKRLRVYLFESMKKARTPYFNVEKYREILVKMLEAKKIAEDVIEDEGYTVLTKTFDSFGFLAETGEAKQLQAQINEELKYSKLQLETMPSAVSFYNVADFLHEDGGWGRVKTGGTDYDEIKGKIIDELKDKDFDSAREIIIEAIQSGDYNRDKLTEYNGVLNQIKSDLNQTTLG